VVVETARAAADRLILRADPLVHHSRRRSTMRAITILSLACFLAVTARAAEIGEISHDELVKAIADKSVVLLDANGSASWRQGHIPGAIDFQADKADLAGKLPADKAALVVAYCGNPKCAAYKAAAEQALALGYTNVKHLREGIAGWKESGAKVEVASLDAAPKKD
jgi:rhodanese-related sulfurtransferase